ncbi:HIT family protein [Candidatus Woesearchaeota archaeon]|nr:HIT family protein [Candidatus Woesearchaeota archaeon]
MNCPFCTIDKGKTKSIQEKEHVLVVFSNPRLMPGHLLVIPKRHVERPSELNADERKELFDTAIEFQEKILTKFAKGCDISQHCRPFLPESWTKVNHVHLHLRPREFEDELYQKSQKGEKDLWKDLPQDEFKRVLQTLNLTKPL